MVSAPKSKGAIQLIPLIILALIVVGVASVKTNEKKQPAYEKVLSKGSENEGGDSSRGSRSGSSGSGGGDDRNSSGSSGSSSTTPISTSPKPAAKPRPTPEIEDQEDENEVDDENNDEEKDEAKPEFTRIRVEENKTRLERVFFEGGVRKKVELRNENGRVRVRVKTETADGVESSQTLDLRPEDGRVTLKIEQDGVEKSVTVRSLADRFIIEQDGFEVPTNFPITVDTELNTITIETPAGIVNVRELPASAIEAALNSRVLSEVTDTELVQNDEIGDSNEQVVYRLRGIRDVKFLGVFSIDAPILAEVSTLTGEQTFVSEPWYLRAFGFLFTK